MSVFFFGVNYEYVTKASEKAFMRQVVFRSPKNDKQIWPFYCQSFAVELWQLGSHLNPVTQAS